MPIGYLISLTLIGACCAAALVRPRRVSRAKYLLTVAITEVPHWALALLLFATALAWWEGDLSGAAGPLLVATAGLIVVGLVVLAARGLRAGPAVDAVVRAQGAQLRRHPVRRVLRPTIFPFSWRPWSVARTGPIRYGEHPRQRLDVYSAKASHQPAPVFVYFHGGGYFSGSNRWEGRGMLHHLASQGWVCISATYRLRPEAGFDDHLADARSVLRWAHDHPDVHGGDPGTLVMAGSSAGAHLTALCALTQEPTRGDRPRVDAAVCLYGYYGRYYGRGLDESPASTPMALHPVSAPPFLMAHGDHDSYVLVDDARALHRHLTAGSPKPVWYMELPGAQHGFDSLFGWRAAAVIEGIDAFLGEVAPRGNAAPTR